MRKKTIIRKEIMDELHKEASKVNDLVFLFKPKHKSKDEKIFMISSKNKKK